MTLGCLDSAKFRASVLEEGVSSQQGNGCSTSHPPYPALLLQENGSKATKGWILMGERTAEMHGKDWGRRSISL